MFEITIFNFYFDQSLNVTNNLLYYTAVMFKFIAVFCITTYHKTGNARNLLSWKLNAFQFSFRKINSVMKNSYI